MNTHAIQAGALARPAERWILWTGRVLTALAVLMLLLSAFMKLTRNPAVVDLFVGTFGFAEGALLGIGLLEIVCVVLYAIPRTAVPGAVLLTGYLGGAIATHVRIGDAFLIPLVLGILVWGGLYLRDERLRALMSLRKTTAER